MSTIEQSVELAVPVQTAQFEDFPVFIDAVEQRPSGSWRGEVARES